jgi:nitroreductase
MNIMDEIESRRARRGLSSEPVDEQIAAGLAYAATLAPSCSNNQPLRISWKKWCILRKLWHSIFHFTITPARDTKTLCPQ